MMPPAALSRSVSQPGLLQIRTRRQPVRPPTTCAGLRSGVELQGWEPQKNGSVKLSVKVSGKTTEAAFEEAVVELGRAVPITGQQLGKGGKPKALPKAMVVNLVGKKRIARFVIDGLVTETICDWAADEGYLVPDQLTAELALGEAVDVLRDSFKSGEAFEFEALFPVQRSERPS